MATIALDPSVPGESSLARTDARGPRRRWTGWHMGLLVLAIGAAVLTTWSVWTGSRSDYYASIALSMSQNWSNFFFGSIDPGGTVTLDKIPGSFWIPALFIKAFGFSTWAVVLPNALAAVGAALLVAVTGKRLLNPTAGLFAGAVVATTPILVAVARSNQPETFFVLGLAAVAWAASKALTRRSFGWLVVAGLFVALSFQTYMLEAWAVWPALGIAWLCTRQPWARRLWTLAVAGVASLGASLLWIAIVSVIPATMRPYIGSTLHNSAWEMVFGYNGLGRFGHTTADISAYRSFTPPFSGDPGVFRLFNENLAGQIGWLVPTAFLAIAVLIALRFRRAITVFLGVWLVTFTAMFSLVAGMHQFYTAALAIPMALLVGLAFAVARRRRSLWAQVSLIAVAAVTAVRIAFSYGGYSIAVAIVQAVIAAGTIGYLVWERRSVRTVRRWTTPAVGILAGASMLFTPLVWSLVAIGNPSSTNPVAGGVSDVGIQGFGGGARGGFGAGAPGGFGAQGGFGGPGGRQGLPGAGGRRANNGTGIGNGFGGGGSGGGGFGGGSFAGGVDAGADTALIAYLRAHAGDARYLAATFGAQSAAQLIIASDGGSFMPIGGFSGSDPVPTLEGFQQLVADGDVRYVIVSGRGQGFGQGFALGGESSTSSQISTWVEQNCAQPSDAPATTLYECSASVAGT